MSVILEIGKYKGKALEEVYDQDASYCRWLYNQQSEDSDIKWFLQGKFQEEMIAILCGGANTRTSP